MIIIYVDDTSHAGALPADLISHAADFYWQDAEKRQLPVLFLLRGPKSTFSVRARYGGPTPHFRPAGATRCTDSCEIWHGRGARESAWPCKISH